jgi:prephenate dehydrogenase (NADP+)
MLSVTHSRSGSPLTILPSGHHVSRISDFILYSVEAEFIDRVVAEFGPCECAECDLTSKAFTNLVYHPTATKFGAVVSGQTSVKAPERAAFEKHLPADVYIISVHSLHGPSVSPEGQPLVSSSVTNIGSRLEPSRKTSKG